MPPISPSFQVGYLRYDSYIKKSIHEKGIKTNDVKVNESFWEVNVNEAEQESKKYLAYYSDLINLSPPFESPPPGQLFSFTMYNIKTTVDEKGREW